MEKLKSVDLKEISFEIESLNSPDHPYIGTQVETPDWQCAHGSKIETGYRINHHSFSQALSSLFTVHNETVNVWTHLLGCLFFIGTLVIVAMQDHQVPVWPLFIHAAGSISMLALSTTYHLFYVCSQSHYVRLQNADYAGIAIMIASSTTPPFYYGFMCSEKMYWRCLWLGQVYICCMIALCVTLAPTKRI